jgi:branched-chain amino acid transport system ATP-binding protein
MSPESAQAAPLPDGSDRHPVAPAGTSKGVQKILEAQGLFAGYGDIAAVRDFNISIREGEVVAILGPNGAGKTTALLTLAGVLPPLGGAVLWRGAPAEGALHVRVRRGLALVPEQHSVIYGLTVRDNLRLGSGGVDPALEWFPELRPLLARTAGLLSGGEQQMLTLARTLASKPSLILVDELSLGLAPLIVERLLDALRTVADRNGTAVLLVEQQVKRALNVADRYYFLRHGAIIDSGQADEAAAERVTSLYLE